MSCLYALPTGNTDTVRLLLRYHKYISLIHGDRIVECIEQLDGGLPRSANTTGWLLTGIHADARLPHFRAHIRKIGSGGSIISSGTTHSECGDSGCGDSRWLRTDGGCYRTSSRRARNESCIGGGRIKSSREKHGE